MGVSFGPTPIRLAVLLCALANLLAGGSSETFTLAGSVVNAVTGEPIRRANVGIHCAAMPQAGTPERTAVADAGGRFEFSNLPPGKCSVWAERRGFQRSTMTQDTGPGSSDLTIGLTPFGVISGKVVDENGDPLIGTSIQTLQSSIVNGGRMIRPTNSGSTNDLGEYRVAQLPPGRYYVTAAVPNATDSELTYARAYYAGANEFASATAVEVAPGGDARADFRLQPAHSYTIRGRITNLPRGSNAMVMLGTSSVADSFNSTARPIQVNSESGEFAVKGVTPGHYSVNATAFEAGSRLASSQDVAIADADVDGVVMVVSKGAEIRGTVRIEEKEGVPALDSQRLGIIMQNKEFAFNPQPSARLKADRTFTISDIAPAEYTLLVTVQEPYYVKSALLGGLDVTASPIAILPGAVPPPLEIVVGANGGELSGTVMKNDEPAPYCGVVVVRRSGGVQERTASTDANGRFKVSALASGDYSVYSWPDIGLIEYRNADVLQRYRGENVTISEGGKQSVELKLNAVP